jgi:Flp pilus assembly pilin Flp
MDLVQRWWREERGSDLIEYALLTSFVAILSAAALALIPGILGAVYQTWDADAQHIWNPCDPGATTTCH